MGSTAPSDETSDPSLLRLQLDGQMICLEAEPQESTLLGRPARRLVGKSLDEILFEDEATAILGMLARVRDEGGNASIVARIQSAVGPPGWAEIAVARSGHSESSDGDTIPDSGKRGVTRLRVSLRDVTERERPLAVGRRRLALESLVADLTGRLLGADGDRIEPTILAGLARLSDAFLSLRTRIISVERLDEGPPLVFSYEKPGYAMSSGGLTWDRLNDFPWCARQLEEHKILEIPDVRELPPDASRDRALFDKIGARSILTITARSNEKVAGLLVFHGLYPSEPISEDEKRLLGIVAGLFAGAMRGQRAERVLRASEERFRALTENSRDSICEIGEAGTILYASPSYADLLGIDQAALVGSDPVDAVHPDDQRRLRALFRAGSRSRRSGTVVYRAMTAAGQSLHLEATAREYEAPDGSPRVVVVSRDVTERENARIALARQIELETRVAELSRFFIDIEVDAIKAGIESRLAVVAGLADAQHSWLHSFKQGGDEVESFDWWKPEWEARKPIALSHTLSSFPYSTGLIQSGRVYHVPDVDVLPAQAANERRDMIDRGVCSILGIPIMSGGRFVGFLGFESFERETSWSEETIMLLRMVGEIFYSALRRRRAGEELRASQSQLLQAQKMEAVGTLAGGIAHDFNNHLAVMLGNARFVRQEIVAEPEVMEAIEDLERAADHCAQLTRSLLAFSRRTPVDVRPVSVREVVEGVEGLVRPLLPSAIRLDMQLLPDLGSFEVDRVQIQQVLVNLLVNARDAMPDGGRITLHVARRRVSRSEDRFEEMDPEQDYVVISVKDEGHGMDAETSARVFEPFFTTKKLGQGTGLGLAMAYGIVRQVKGGITLESAPGEGATFRVFLPSARSAPAADSKEMRPKPRDVARGRVLLIGREPAMRRLVGRILVRSGYSLEIASDVEEARRRLEAAPATFDLVVADLEGPEASPKDLLEALRRLDPDLRVLLLAGYCARVEGETAQLGDSTEILIKPFGEEMLLHSVGKMLA